MKIYLDELDSEVGVGGQVHTGRDDDFFQLGLDHRDFLRLRQRRRDFARDRGDVLEELGKLVPVAELVEVQRVENFDGDEDAPGFDLLHFFVDGFFHGVDFGLGEAGPD